MLTGRDERACMLYARTLKATASRGSYPINTLTTFVPLVVPALRFHPCRSQVEHSLYSAFDYTLYVPLDPEFRCEGGPHYPHNKFQKVATMEYKPNSLCAFFKNDHSFHGVEPIKDEHVQRDVLLYDIRVIKSKDDAKPAGAVAGGMALRILRGLFGSKQR